MQDRVSKIVERSNSANTEPANKASLRDAGALIAEAQEGVRVRLVYDRMGGPGKTSRKSWNLLRAGGVEVRYYNPPQFDSPFGWLSRDHRKMLTVDGEISFIACPLP